MYLLRLTAYLSNNCMNILFQTCAPLYPSSKIATCILSFILCIESIINFKKTRPMQNMGKNIKSYATTPSPFPREREGSLTAKSP